MKRAAVSLLEKIMLLTFLNIKAFKNNENQR
jgi:hypothetical protein